MDINSNLNDCTDASVVISSRDEVDFIAVSNNNNYNDKVHNDKTESDITNNVPVIMDALNAGGQVEDGSQHNSTILNPNSLAQRSKISSSEADKKLKSTNNMNGDVNKATKKERKSIFSFTKKFSHKVSKDALDKKTKQDSNKPKAGTNPSFMVPVQPPPIPIGTPPRQQKFVKNSSLARLLGSSTYHAKTFDRDDQKRMPKDGKFKTYGGRRRPSGPYLDRFRGSTKDDSDLTITKNLNNPTDNCNVDANSLFLKNSETREDMDGSRGDLVSLAHFHENQPEDLSTNAFRMFSRNLGRKLWWKRSQSVNISTPDPEFKVSYLGNVLTGWAKGEGCVEKQLNTLWRNYTQNTKPDVIMRIKVCASGLKATTRQHGLTEYWANRITHCCAPKNYPRVFCWIYRHEGRKLKHELRCHAVLCSKEKIVHDICNTLKENLESALREFKREKILRQNARLSLANAVYDNPSLPRRKIMLSVGGNNYRPPLERSKSAPKLMAIEEAIGEEDGDEVEETNEPEMKPCCQKDSLYPAMTLGRRHCRRGHSIRRTGKARPCFLLDKHHPRGDDCCTNNALKTKDVTILHMEKSPISGTGEIIPCEQRDTYGSDDSDDFEKLLKQNDYDSKSSLTNELLPYFDLQLNKKLSSSLGSLSELKCGDEEPLSLSPTINSHPSAEPETDYGHSLNGDDEVEVVGLRRNGICSDGEEDYLDADETAYFRQTALLNMLHRNSMRKMAHLSLSSDENSSLDTNNSTSLQYSHQLQSSISSNASSATTYSSGSCSASTSGSIGVDNSNSAGQLGCKEACKQIAPDSDEGSISSGCETASTVTANQDDISLQSHQHNNKTYDKDLSIGLDEIKIPSEHGFLDEESPITVDEIYQRLECRLQKRHNSDATTFSSSSSNTLKVGSSSSLAASVTELNDTNGMSKNANPSGTRMRRSRRSSLTQRAHGEGSMGDSDSEYSDESGYVEYQERNKSMKPIKCNKTSTSVQSQQLERSNAMKQQIPPKPMPRRSLAVDNNRSNNLNSATSTTKTTTAV